MRFGRAIGSALVTLACISAEVRAQPLVGVTVGVSEQGAGDSDIPYLGPPFAGTSLSSVFMLDVPVGRTVSIGGEASLAASIRGEQSQRLSGGTADFLSRHHDTILSADLKAGMPFTGRVRAAAVGGLGLAWRQTSRSGTVRQEFGSRATVPFNEKVTTVVPAVLGGADVAVRVAQKVAILAGGRLHYLFDDDRTEDGVVRRGVSSLVVRVGAGVQIGF
jgi:hypothetical protein